jgi:cell pole-organizing protein PopZ
MADPKPQKEPSMEEILASIRRIISEDGDAAPSGQEANDAAAEDADAEPETVLDLTQEVDAEGNPVIPDAPPSQAAAEEAPAKEAAPAEAEQAEKAEQADIDAMEFDAVPAASPEPPAASEGDGTLVGSDTEASTAASFAALTEKMAPPKPASQTPGVSAGGRTVEQLAADLLRPMLQDWLDENLPGLVERLVKREIERIARNGRR